MFVPIKCQHGSHKSQFTITYGILKAVSIHSQFPIYCGIDGGYSITIYYTYKFEFKIS